MKIDVRKYQEHAKILKHKSTLAILDLLAIIKPMPKPLPLIGENSSETLCDYIWGYKHQKILLVIDRMLVNIGLHRSVVEKLTSLGVEVVVFSDVDSDPSIEQMELGARVAIENSCDGVVAFGGGSSIDCAKVIAARVTNAIDIRKMEGLFKIKKMPLKLYAIPTTAGTGSEATVAAVVSDLENKRKFTVADFQLMPSVIALDPLLTLGLPPEITAATGMDALTHAVEAYISTRANDEVRSNAAFAIKLIFKSLLNAYQDGSNVQARKDVCLAAFHGGVVINMVGVGYVHAFAHQLGGFYHVPHGVANAVLLPLVLEMSVDKIEHQLRELAELIELGEENSTSDRDYAMQFIQAVRELGRKMEIPITIQSLKAEDIDAITGRALDEALEISGVPKYFDKSHGRELLATISEF